MSSFPGLWRCLSALTVYLSFTNVLAESQHGLQLSNCTSPSLRMEWGSLTKAQRKNYINAVKCLQTKPSRYAKGLVPGSFSLYDDFAAVHINKTLNIHFNGVFLAWHREFTYLWEQALRDECGYVGHQPYWDWSLSVVNGSIATSPLFDGSDTSIGGNGYPSDSYNSTSFGTSANGTALSVPRGTGGGCMIDGPFNTTKATMGPFPRDAIIAAGRLPANWTQPNPHCLLRDFNDEVAPFLNYTYYEKTLAIESFADFNNEISPVGGINAGFHGTGHFIVGHSMFDFFASPFDPAFFLHHGAIDRFWYQWQSIDEHGRVYGNKAINGSQSLFNAPTTPVVTFDTVIDWGVFGKPKTMRELMSTLAGDYCYVYQ